MIQTSPNLTKRLNLMRWLIPLVFSITAILFQLIVANWVHDVLGENIHYGVEILFFATAGPLLAYWVLSLIGRWFTEKGDAEYQARLSERRLAAITTASADAILSINPTGQIESWNTGAELLFGYQENEIRGQPLTHLLKSRDGAAIELQWLLDTVHKSGYLRGHETTCLDVAKEEITVELTATELTDPHGSSYGTSIILRDITNRKQREEEIRHLNITLNQQVSDRTRELAEKVEDLATANAELQKLDLMRAEFVSLVSHQIRAPLTNMRGAIERMQTDCAMVGTNCSQMTSILNEQIDRLNRLVKDVLSMARIEGGELIVHREPLSMLPLVQQVVDQTLARTSDRAIRIFPKPGLPMVFADRDHIAEILTNLLDNADKYTPVDSEISIDVRASQTEFVISVRDTGPGLPEESLPRVFDKFYRNDSSDSQIAYGYGLGLYLCRNLVEAQGGRIWAENHPGGGAIFSFTLPIWQGENESSEDINH